MSVDNRVFPPQMQQFRNYKPALKSSLVKGKCSDVQNDLC